MYAAAKSRKEPGLDKRPSGAVHTRARHDCFTHAVTSTVISDGNKNKKEKALTFTATAETSFKAVLRSPLTVGINSIKGNKHLLPSFCLNPLTEQSFPCCPN